MRIAIVEDSAADAKALKEMMLRLLPPELGLAQLDVYDGAADFLAADRYYELLLIDCLLPETSGVELAKTVRRTNTTSAIIFITAYMDYAAEGYETNALRYLLKPVEEEKLAEALTYFAGLQTRDAVVELTGTTRYAAFVKKSEILYVEYVGRKVVVRLEGRAVESHRTMKEFESLLGPDFFFRTAQRFLVNFSHIAEKNDKTLILDNGERVAISGRKLMPFNQAYIRFLRKG